MDAVLTLTRGHGRWTFDPPRPLPVAALLLGRPVTEAATLLPRLFNLCSGAQALALRLALGLPLPDRAALRSEILRDHVLKLCLLWPRLLGLPATPLPPDWQSPGTLRRLIWGQADPADLPAFLTSGQGVAPVLQAIAKAFAPGEAVADLPRTTAATVMLPVAQDNSVAARHAAALRPIAATRGHGPLWRAAGLIQDIAALLDSMPDGRMFGDVAMVDAARGAYGVQARAVAGLVTAFARCTPTDHLCAPGGVLRQSLDSLPPHKGHLLPLLIDILSPCVPVRVVPDA